MRLIDAEELERLFYEKVESGATDLFDAFEDALQEAQTVDAVPVVRCKDCGISRKEQSKFTVRQGEIVFEQNGYKKLVEMWNRRCEK